MQGAIYRKDGSIEIYEGTLLIEDCIAIKVGPGDWRVVDQSSGVLVKAGFRSLGQCREFVADLPDRYRERLELFRSSEKFKRLSADVRKELLDSYGR